MRGSFVTNRPAFRRLEISYGDVFDGTGLVQGVCYYQPDYGTETIVAAIGGRLLAFSPGTLTVAVEDITQGVFMDATVAQNWLWQSENYIINNDGYSTPRIFDGTLTRLANVETPIATIASGFGIPDVGQYATADLTAPYTGPVNIRVRISSGTTEYGNFEIVPPGTTGAGYTIQLTNNNDTGMTEPVGAAVQIVNSYTGKCAVSAVLSIASKKQIQLDTAFTGVVGDSVSFNALNMTVGGSVHVTEPVTAISADLMTITVQYKSNYPVQILTGAVVSKGNGGPPTVDSAAKRLAARSPPT